RYSVSAGSARARRHPCRWRRRGRCLADRPRSARREIAASADPVRARGKPRIGRTSGRAERTASARRRPGPWRRVYARRVELSERLNAIAAAAERFAAPGERVDAVLVAEAVPGERVYLCAYAGADGRTWLAFDESAEPIMSRNPVREAVSIAAMCELADEQAGGGELEELRQRLVALRVTENPPGIEEA